MIRTFALGLLLLLGGQSHAADWLIPATVKEVYDGDTIRAVAQIWPDQYLEVSVRVDGIDTPEIRGGCDSEKAKAQEAKVFLSAALGPEFTIRNPRPGKFARRIVADVTTQDGRDVATLMIEAGYARPYSGGHRSGWCDAEQ